MAAQTHTFLSSVLKIYRSLIFPLSSSFHARGYHNFLVNYNIISNVYEHHVISKNTNTILFSLFNKKICHSVKKYKNHVHDVSLKKININRPIQFNTTCHFSSIHGVIHNIINGNSE